MAHAHHVGLDHIYDVFPVLADNRNVSVERPRATYFATFAEPRTISSRTSQEPSVVCTISARTSSQLKARVTTQISEAYRRSYVWNISLHSTSRSTSFSSSHKASRYSHSSRWTIECIIAPFSGLLNLWRIRNLVCEPRQWRSYIFMMFSFIASRTLVPGRWSGEACSRTPFGPFLALSLSTSLPIVVEENSAASFPYKSLTRRGRSQKFAYSSKAPAMTLDASRWSRRHKTCPRSSAKIEMRLDEQNRINSVTINGSVGLDVVTARKHRDPYFRVFAL